MRKKSVICMLVIAAMGVSGCGKQEEVKNTSVSIEKGEETTVSNCNINKMNYDLNFNEEMVIDFLCYEDKLESYSCSAKLDESQQPVFSMIKRVYSSNGIDKTEIEPKGEWQCMEVEVEGNTQTVKQLTDLVMTENGDVIGLWQKFQSDITDPEGNENYIDRGIVKMKRDDFTITEMASGLITDETKSDEAADFVVNENDEYILYYPDMKRFELFDTDGKMLQKIDMSTQITGKVQFQGGFIWTINKEDNSMLKIDTTSLEERNVIDVDVQNDSWCIVGNEELGFVLIDTQGSTQISGENELHNIKFNGDFGDGTVLKHGEIAVSSNKLHGYLLDRESEVENVWEEIYEVSVR